MFFYLEGVLETKGDKEIILRRGGIGYRIFVNQQTLNRIGEEGKKIKIFVLVFLKENQQLEAYGFLSGIEVKLFENLISVSGIGTKTALAILNQSSPEEIIWAIGEGKSEFLEKVSGIGRKTAQRIILELQNKINLVFSKLGKKEYSGDNVELVQILSNLGFRKDEIREAISKLDPSLESVEEKIKFLLQILGKNKFLNQ